MLPDRCKLALNNLMAFQPQPVPKLKHRDFFPPVVMTEPPNDTEIQNYYWINRNAIIKSAATFGYELIEAGVAKGFLDRVASFEKYTEKSSPFDQSRLAFLQALSPDNTTNLYLADWVIDRDVGPTNAIPRIRAHHESVDQVRWRLPGAFEDVDRLLKSGEFDESIRGVLRDWHGKVWDLMMLDEKEHLFGSFLLNLCVKSRAVPGDQKKLEERLIQVSHDWTRLVEKLKRTAEFLFVADENSPSSNQTTAEIANMGAKVSGAWCHEPGIPRPPEYKKGPLRGTQIFLADVVCPPAGREPDPRALQRLGRTGVIWIERYGTQDFAVYFMDDDLWPQANARYLQQKKDKPPRKKRKT